MSLAVTQTPMKYHQLELMWEARNNNNLYLFPPLEFFTSVLADGFSLEFQWLQATLSLQDSSQYSGRSQSCCHLDILYPSANFQVLQAF